MPFAQLILAIILFTYPNISLSSSKVYSIKYLKASSGEKILLSEKTTHINPKVFETGFYKIEYPSILVEEEPLADNFITEIYSTNNESLIKYIKKEDIKFSPPKKSFVNIQDEVLTLFESGPPKNRIDLVFMGDGYTTEEKSKFIKDVNALIKDIFEGPTYKAYLPIFNIHAVFRASNESGIGRNSIPKDTAYGLYRPGFTLRAILPTKENALRDSCSKAPECDYPIVVANDPYYGGLGGEFAITTSSQKSGPIVLRHELGHNFGRVGEEYDGGGHFGANYSPSLSTLKWKHWLSGELRAEPMKATVLKWPWHNLSNSDYTINFKSDVGYPYRQIRISLSGNEVDEKISATFDNDSLVIKSQQDPDRFFQDIFFDNNANPGLHELKFSQDILGEDSWVSSVHIHEYREDFNFDKTYIGAFPLFYAINDMDGFRPSNESCLMRNMEHPTFCPICQENNWLKFFERVTLIDNVHISKTDSNVNVNLSLPDLGQFRKLNKSSEEFLEIQWYKNGVLISDLNGQTTWSLPRQAATGKWNLIVSFKTPEVRSDPRKLLNSNYNFEINS